MIQLSYAIGVSKPLSIYLKLSEKDEDKTHELIKIINNNFDLSPRGIRELLGLNKPIYQITAAYGHFGRKSNEKGEFSWEKTDKTQIFKLLSWKNLNNLLKRFNIASNFKMGFCPFFFGGMKCWIEDWINLSCYEL